MAEPEGTADDRAVFLLCEVLALMFILPLGETIYRGESITGRHVAFFLLGMFFCAAGPGWPSVKHRLGTRFSASVGKAASDFRWWLALLLFIFVYFAIGPRYAAWHAANEMATQPPATATTPTAPGPIDYNVFTPGTPFPRGFGLVQRGTRLSATKAAYPEGNLGRGAFGLGSYNVSINNGGPFAMVLYYFEDNPGDPDPVILEADFRMVDSSVAKVKAAALAAWGSDGFSEAPSGQRSSWADIGGYSVTIDREQFLIRWRRVPG